MSINKNYDTFTNGYDDNYKDVLSALSQLDDSADIDYVKENYKHERKLKNARRTFLPHTWQYNSRHRRMDFHPLRHAARFWNFLIQKKCA